MLNLRSSCVSVSACPYLTLRFKGATEQLSLCGCEPKCLELGLCLPSLKIRALGVAWPGVDALFLDSGDWVEVKFSGGGHEGTLKMEGYRNLLI